MNATSPNPHDNPTAGAVRSGYRNQEQYLEQLQNQAEGRAHQYGAGTHRLKNGDTLCVSPGPDGTETVTSYGPQGQDPQSVTYNTHDPSYLSVENSQGTIQRQGTTITDNQGNGQTSIYGLNQDGSPYHISYGPDGSNWQESVARDDGSSDNFTYQPDAGGQLQEVRHREPPNPFATYPIHQPGGLNQELG
ncbi:MAG: hypothetical protein ACYCW6_15960 [Candidatus Xenobia bacterium]